MTAKKYKTKKTMNDRAHDAIVEMATSLYKIGVIDEFELNGFIIKIPKVKKFNRKEIKRIRLKTKLNQAVFAKLLNVSLEAVKKWEQGDRHPTGASLKLLNLIAMHGSEALY